MELKEFLRQHEISEEDWAKSALNWEGLIEIANDHEQNTEQLRDIAEFFVRIIQKIPKVHSVRWRVKDPGHLLEKIIRKKLEGSEKYSEINKQNYTSIVTDLVGLRALHLFKDDCFSIGDELQRKWKPIESPVAYIRSGDQEELSEQLRKYGLEVKPHPAGYRSVHYVFSSQALQRPVSVEVQVRTIFEEGWSEIDHRIRYPNFSDDPLVTYFLTIFNRLSGSADEMGGFVKGLASTLSELQTKVEEANVEKENSLQEMEKVVAELSQLRIQDAKSRELMDKLKIDMAQLRKNYESESIHDQAEKRIVPLVINSNQQKNINISTEVEKLQNSEWYKLLILLGGAHKSK